MNKIDHPEHYNQGKTECIEIIEELGLNFNLGNALKYIWRCDSKGKKREDLQKAIWYLQREINSIKEMEEILVTDLEGEKTIMVEKWLDEAIAELAKRVAYD